MIAGLFGDRHRSDAGACGSEEVDAIALKNDVGPAKLEYLFQKLTFDVSALIADIRAAIGAHAFADIRNTAHRLGGLLGQFGAADLAEMAATIESADGPAPALLADGFAAQCEAAMDPIAKPARSVIAEGAAQ
ncbi:MAG: Hpt domain-containing protein [Rhodoplanes sp.]